MKKILIINTAYYAIVFVLIGVPIWYLTTTTYRASLPFDQIDKMSSMAYIEYQANLELIYSNLQRNKDFDNLLISKLSEDFKGTDGFRFKFNIKSRQIDLKEVDLFASSSNLEGLIIIIMKLTKN